MRGQKYPLEIKEKAKVKLILNNNISAVSKSMGIPVTTLIGWIKEWNKSEDFAELRELKRKEFIEKAWQSAYRGLQKTAEALEGIDSSSVDPSGVSQLASATSKLYQMHQLASGESTENVNINGAISFSDIQE